MESKKVVLDEFQHIPLFEALNDLQLEQILNTTQKMSLPARTTLFEMGLKAEHFYMVHSGQIKLFCLSPQGDEKVVEILYPSQTFAEAVMFMPRHIYPVSAEAITESVVFRFDMNIFHKMLKESQESCFRLLAIMSRQLHAKISDINSLTLHNATYRLIVYLLRELPRDVATLSDIHLSTPKNIIASRLSIKPETFSRILQQIRKQGLIEIHGNDITILDAEGLRALL